MDKIQRKKKVRADYQAQIETQLSNKKFITIMASATGGFRFLTKKIVFITWFRLSTRGFFKTISDDFSKWYFFLHILILSKLWNFPKKHKIRCERSLVVLPGCFWILEIAYHSAAEIVPFFCFFHFFSRSQNVWNSNFVNIKSEKWYFFFNCGIFFLNVKFQKLPRKRPSKKKKYHLRNEKYHSRKF